MDKLIIGIIFSALGISLYQNRKKAGKRYEKAKEGAVIISDHGANDSFKKMQMLLGGMIFMIIFYLMLSVVITLQQTPVLLMIIVFLGLYYTSFYMLNNEWFFDQEGVWSRQQLRPVTYENIVSYEWREYKEKLVLRLHYKGRGIMLVSSDFWVSTDQRAAVTKRLEQLMAGM